DITPPARLTGLSIAVTMRDSARYSFKVVRVSSTTQTPTCPDCGASVHRSHRRPLERLTSVIVPQYRYRCYQCGWTGLQHFRRSPLQIGPRGHKVVITRERMVIIVLCVLLAISLAAILATAKV
ncbi:MAG TPA: hypothetical protein VII92_20785, partial [Anaerolineae bacterium]